MIKNVLAILVPLIAPAALYLLLKRGQGESPVIAARNAPWIWLGAAGVVLAAAVLSFWALSTGGEPGANYQPPRVVDGKVVPGGFTEPADPDSRPGGS